MSFLFTGPDHDNYEQARDRFVQAIAPLRSSEERERYAELLDDMLHAFANAKASDDRQYEWESQQ